MSDFPQKLYRTPGPDSVVVNTAAERDAAIKNGYQPDLPVHQEFPKMVYLHPADKTQEHNFIVVNTPTEKDAALKQGYQVKPHVPVAEDEFESVPGSPRPPSTATLQGENSEAAARAEYERHLAEQQAAHIPAAPTTETPEVEKPV